MTTEAAVQDLLMRWVMTTKNHFAAVPNSTELLLSEADLLSVTRSRLVHEYEIKCSVADYNRELNGNGRRGRKRYKHWVLRGDGNGRRGRTPNYFWFVTVNFNIDPPEYAGWIKVTDDGLGNGLHMYVKKDAPRLHLRKWDDRQLAKVARLLSFRLMNRGLQ